jgi:hypothetical protein
MSESHCARPRMATSGPYWRLAPRTQIKASPSAQSRALGPEAEAEMARELTTGRAQAVAPEDFNERVKRLLADKPGPRKAEPRSRNFKGSTRFARN